LIFLVSSPFSRGSLLSFQKKWKQTKTPIFSSFPVELAGPSPFETKNLSRLHTEPSLDKEQRSHSPILEQKQREPGAAASLPVSVHKGQTGAGPPSFIKIFLLFSPARSKAPSSPQKEEAVVPPPLL